jgi:hypothetical protein
MRPGYLLVWPAALALLAFAAPAFGGVVFSDDFGAILPSDDVNPGANDEPGRQAGTAAPLDYVEDADTGVGGLRPNLTQINNPDYPDAILLAPSNDFGFEKTIFIQPDHDFIDHPGAGGRMVISFEANPVHPSAGVQVAADAALSVTFLHGLEFQLFDGGEWVFFGDGAFMSSGDLDPGDPGGLAGSFEGFHAIEVEAITDFFLAGNDLDIRVKVDGAFVAIDTDGSPTVFESSVAVAPSNAILIKGRTDPAAPAKVGGFTVFTLHGVDDLEVSIQIFDVPAMPGVAWALLAASLVAAAFLASRSRLTVRLSAGIGRGDSSR